MKKCLALILLLTGTLLYSTDFKDMLEEVDSLASYTNSDFSSQYTFVESEADGQRTKTVASVFRRDKDEKYVIVIMEPAVSLGQGYLKVEETLWFYDPESRRFNFTSSKDRFQNTSARNSDFTRSTLAQDYTVESGEQVKLGSYNCWMLELTANNDEVTYPYARIWIDENSLIRKKEDYSLSRQLLRTSLFPSYQRVSNRSIPYQFLLVESLTKKRTQVTIDRVSFDDIPDSTFSKQYLESVSR